ncbi:MAG: octanoyltransferase, partial [Pseudobdellovibrionaceae bacterium]
MRVESWGLVDYSAAVEKQLMLVEEVAAGGEEVLVFCSHPPVATLGRATRPDDITTWTGAILEVSRGGRVTYHGPSQLVIYPILNLNLKRANRSPRDLVGYIRDLEDSIADLLQEYGFEARGKSLQGRTDKEIPQEETGVWVLDSQKRSR